MEEKYNLLTVITPVFNRKKELERLYNSLCNQSQKDFRWLIVDDGSSDNVEEKIKEWKRESSFDLRYVKKENGGKHTALNRGIRLINTELTFIVDSDDWLPENAIEIILKYHKKWRGTKGLCGYSFLRFYPNGQVNEAFFPEDERVDTYVNVRINGGIAGDKAEVFVTEVLKKYPFPVFGNEKFVPEDLVWVKMSGFYKMVHINECVYIGEYLEGGLTRSGRRMKLQSPRGMMERSYIYLQDDKVNVKTKLKMALLFDVYRNAVSRSELTEQEKERHSCLIELCRLPGWIIYWYWKMKYKD